MVIKIVAELLEKAEIKGYLTMEDVLEALDQGNDDITEAVLAELRAAGVEVEAEESEPPLSIAADPNTLPDFLESPSITTGGWDDDLHSLERVGVEDTVALYLREMGRVPLLSEHEEVTLARQIEEGREAQIRLQSTTCPAEERQTL